MAASDTQKAAPSKSALTKVFTPFVSRLQDGAKVLHAAEEGLAAAKLAIGRTINETVVAFTAAGGSVEDVQTRILSTIGGDYSWNYVASWQRAAVVYDELHESSPAVAEAFSGSIEALTSVGRLPKDERFTIAEDLVKKGTTGVRAIRDALGALPAQDGKKRSAQKGTTALTSKLQKVRDGITIPDGLAWSPELQTLVNEMTLLGVRIGKGGKMPNKSETMAAETLAYFGPVSDETESEDS